MLKSSNGYFHGPIKGSQGYEEVCGRVGQLDQYGFVDYC